MTPGLAHMTVPSLWTIAGLKSRIGNYILPSDYFNAVSGVHILFSVSVAN